MNRTQRLCRVLRYFASVLFGLSIFALVVSPFMSFSPGFVLDFANHQLRLLDVDAFRFTSEHLNWMLRTNAFLWLALAMGSAVLSLGALIRLLQQFEDGKAFSGESARLVRFLGWLQIATAPATMLMSWSLALTTRALLHQSIPPWRSAFGESLGALFFGGITLLIAHILDEGFRLKTEQDLVI